MNDDIEYYLGVEDLKDSMKAKKKNFYVNINHLIYRLILKKLYYIQSLIDGYVMMKQHLVKLFLVLIGVTYNDRNKYFPQDRNQ